MEYKDVAFWAKFNRELWKIMNILIDFTQIPIQKVGVGVYARETFLELLRGTNNKYYCLVQDDDKDMLNTLKSSKIIFVKSKWFRFFSLDSS